MSSTAMVTLPPGATVHVGGQRYRGEIPANLCPKKYRESDKPASKPPKAESKMGEQE